MTNYKLIGGIAFGIGCVGGCGDGGATTASAGESSGASSATTVSTGETTGDTAPTSATAASMSASASTADTTGTTGATNVSATNDDSAEDATFDVGLVPDAPMQPCTMSKGGGGDEPDFSFLWAANASQGTITKIDTQTVTEVGRYIVRPDSIGSPSRTSVNLEGDVAVGNRSGGITKIYALEDRCQESNGQPGIQTSDSNAFLPWGEEECIAWYSPFAYASQRPVAWTQGEFDLNTCSYVNSMLWTSGTNASTDVLLLDGEDGAVVDMVTLEGYPQDFYGIYGGAVDGEGNFWGTKLGGVMLVRVMLDNMDVTMWPVPTSSYGMTVDSEGYVWACSSTYGRFDPMTETWAQGNGGGYAGCMAERGEDGLLWMAGGNSIIGIDRHDLVPAANLPVPDAYGVSIDYYGYVWTVGQAAHRVDKETMEVTSYNGLTGPYTYSDMTGYALTYAGGGGPSG